MAGRVSVADIGRGTEELVLRRYQEGMRRWAWDVPRCALWADMGLGKTPTALLSMLDALYERSLVERWLVVGPKLVVGDAWPRQLMRWRQLAGVPWRVLTGDDFGLRAAVDAETGRRTGLTFGSRADKAARKRGLRQYREPITLVSWDWLPWLVKAWGDSWPYDGLVLDEAIFGATVGSRRHQAAWHVCQALPGRVSRIIELTGAPVPNGYEALCGQIRLLDGGVRLGGTLGEFRGRWMLPDKRDDRRGVVYSWRLAPGKQREVDTAVSDLAVSLASADYLQMPELVQVERWVELPPRARAMYDAMEADLVLQIDGQDIIAASAGVLVNKLLQIASGCLYDQDRQVHELHQAKLDALAELLEAQPGPVLLLYPYKPDWERIQARFKGAKHISAPGALDAFRAGGVKLLGMHPASGAHGVDGLQGASSAMVWYGATYNADHWAQAIKRLHRDGQRAGRVVVHQILAADTIEEYVAGKALSAKLTLQEHLLAAVSMRRHRHALLTSDV